MHKIDKGVDRICCLITTLQKNVFTFCKLDIFVNFIDEAKCEPLVGM